MLRFKVIFFVISFFLFLPLISNSATVMNNADSGAGSLREAIDNAVDAEIIDFDASLNGMTITLLSQITIDDSIMIVGSGSGQLTIQSDGSDRIFAITDDDAPVTPDLNVTISGLTLTGGRTGSFGGAIFSEENLTLEDVVIEDNMSNQGGGIFNDEGNLTINNSIIMNNHLNGLGQGGGINHNTGELLIDETVISSNTANQGGGIFTSSATTTISNSVIEENSTAAGSPSNSGGGVQASRGVLNIINSTVSDNMSRSGGGVIMFGFTGNPGQLNISRSTFNNNTALNGSGGAISNILSVLNLDNSTISGNFAFNLNAPDVITTSGRGAAIRNTFANSSADLANRATANISNTTIINNNGDEQGVAINNGVIDIVNIKNTLLINNTANNETDRVVCSSSGTNAEFNDLGGNISDVEFINGTNNNERCFQFHDASFNPVSMIEMNLADNSGPTETHALLDPDPVNTPNPALDSIALADCTTVSSDNVDTDQRGVSRPQGTGCDVGAFELQLDTDGDGTFDDDEECPNDPNKTEAGQCGCGEVETGDTDNDGTLDCVDNCVDDMNKTEPGLCGCGIADTDTDADGTADCNDNCVDDPAKIEPGVCGCGVADSDTDSDGTPDCNDECPDDPNKTEPGECGCGVAEGCNDVEDPSPNNPPEVDSDNGSISIVNNDPDNPLSSVVINIDLPDGVLPLAVQTIPNIANCSINNSSIANIAEEDINITCEVDDIDEELEIVLSLCNDGNTNAIANAIVEIISPDLDETTEDFIEILVEELNACQVDGEDDDENEDSDGGGGCSIADSGSQTNIPSSLILLIPLLLIFRRGILVRFTRM